MSCAQAHWVGSKPIRTDGTVMQLKLHIKPTMACIGYPDSKNLGHAQLGESLVMLIGPSWEPNLLPFWAPNLGPLGKQDLCNNFALTAAKFLFSNSGNFRAKANPPKPRSCPKCPFGQ